MWVLKALVTLVHVSVLLALNMMNYALVSNILSIKCDKETIVKREVVLRVKEPRKLGPILGD